jgi:glutamine amidotransferase
LSDGVEAEGKRGRADGSAPDVAIVDVGLGNLRSVERAVARAGGRPFVTSDAAAVEAAAIALFPGQGAFGDAMHGLASAGLGPVLAARIGAGRPYLGICLGPQILFDRSEEAHGVAGLGVIGGDVARFEARPGRKVPHVGWNEVAVVAPGSNALPAGERFYFTHSYYARPRDRAVVAGWTDYDGVEIASAVSLSGGRVLAVQFHPEKSQQAGAMLLQRYLASCA